MGRRAVQGTVRFLAEGADVTKESNAKLQAHRKAAGLCVRCGAPAPVLTRCTACTFADHVRTRADRKTRSMRGQCALCQLPSLPRLRVCAGHREKERLKRASQRRRRIVTCVKCPLPTSQSGIRCERHRREHAREVAAAASARVSAGYCSQCGRGPLATKRLCRQCADRHRDASRAWRAAK